VTKTALAALTLAAGLAAPALADCRFTLNFDHGSARLELADGLLLGDLARAYPAAQMVLSAHADDDGTAAQNRRIAEARAASVAARLGRDGGPQAVRALALAADWDAVPTQGWSSPLNRRVELFVAGCDPAAHPEARLPWAPGVAFDGAGGVELTSPLVPAG
jgi:hypothetical protein